MIETITVEKKRDVLSLVPGVVFATVPGWFNATWDQLKMDIIMPKNREGHRRLPCLVWVCGGGFMDVDTSVWLPELVRIADAGFVIASVQYRVSSEAQFPAALQDVKAAVRFLRAHADRYCIDPEHIFSMGESAGGTMASLLGVTGGDRDNDVGENLEFSSAVQGVVDVYGLTEIGKVQAIDPDCGLPYYLMEAFLGVGYTPEQARAASAASLADSSAPPFLILHGTADTTVDPAQSRMMYDALAAAGVPAQLVYVTGAGHGDDLIYQDEVIGRVIAFLKSLCK